MGRDVEILTCPECGGAMVDTAKARRLHRDWHARVVVTRGQTAPSRFVGVDVDLDDDD